MVIALIALDRKIALAQAILAPPVAGGGDPSTSGAGDPSTSSGGDPGTSGAGDPDASGTSDPGTSGTGDPGTSGTGVPGIIGVGDAIIGQPRFTLVERQLHLLPLLATHLNSFPFSWKYTRVTVI